jgi:hypothetical protein
MSLMAVPSAAQFVQQTPDIGQLMTSHTVESKIAER